MPHTSVVSPYILKFAKPLEANLVANVDKALAHKNVAVKDLFHIAGYPTSAGNPDWLASHVIPTETSPVITELLKQGATLVGKTITDELAYSLNGQNIHYGTPINTKNPNLLPGGSSSGSAIAVAEGSADIGLGTDTGGSIRVPASYNGLFGLRPSHGLISTEHMVELAPRFDTVGWITRDLATLTTVAEVLLPPQASLIADKPVVLGTSHLLNATCQHHTHLTSIIDNLKQSGVYRLSDISEQLSLHVLEQGVVAFRKLQGAEIWATHGEWITEQQPRFAPDIAARFKWCQTVSPAQVKQALAVQADFCQLLERIFGQVDFVLLPTTPGSAPLLSAAEHQLNQNRNTLLSMTCIAGLGGLPQLQIPLLQREQAPVGLSIIGPRNSDHTIIQFAKILLETLK